jgi:hypothetical protein
MIHKIKYGYVTEAWHIVPKPIGFIACLIQDLLCKIGLHKWVEHQHEPGPWEQYCYRCGITRK